MRKILVVTENRSEKGLLEPIVKELELRKDVEVKFLDISGIPQYPLGQNVIERIKSHFAIFKPAIVLVPTDRDAMVYVAAHALHEGYIVSQLHAGDIGSGINDESNRFAISFLSHILFCNSVQSAENLYKMGFEFWRVHVIGSSALDDIEIDESLCLKEPYDLVLLHPDPISREATFKDLTDTIRIISKSKAIVWCRPNQDKNHEIIDDYLRPRSINEMGLTATYLEVYVNLPRSQFLGLLTNCSRGIGNSSSFIYELPLLNPKAERIMIGKRNSEERTPPSTELGASARIAEILATIPIDDKLRRKKLIL